MCGLCSDSTVRACTNDDNSAVVCSPNCGIASDQFMARATVSGVTGRL